MTLDQLKVLAAIVETGSFRAAADRLHRAQSAVSYAIKTIEEEFDLLIFDRANYRPVLTQEGRTLYQKSKPLIEQADELAKLCEHMATGEELDFRLVVNPLAPLPSVLDVVGLFEEKFPMTSLHLEVADQDEPLLSLMSDKADIAICQVDKWQDKLESVLWRRLEIIPFCHPDYCLKIENSGLNQATQVIVASKDADSKPIGLIASSKHWFVDTYASLIAVVQSGLAWGFAPHCLIAAAIQNGDLSRLEEVDTINQDLYLSRKRGRPLGEAHQFLWDELVKKQSGTRHD